MEARSTALANRSDLELRQAAKTFLHVFVGRSIILSYFNPCQGLAVVPRHPFRGTTARPWHGLKYESMMDRPTKTCKNVLAACRSSRSDRLARAVDRASIRRNRSAVRV